MLKALIRPKRAGVSTYWLSPDRDLTGGVQDIGLAPPVFCYPLRKPSTPHRMSSQFVINMVLGKLIRAGSLCFSVPKDYISILYCLLLGTPLRLVPNLPSRIVDYALSALPQADPPD